MSDKRLGQAGFTLIEMLVVVAMIGILAAVALPAYQDYVRRGNVPEATSCLTQWRTTMEQWFQDNRSYALDSAGVANPSCETNVCAGKNFDVQLTCGAADPPTYLLTATGKVGGSMEGFSYTINEQNQRKSTTPWAVGEQDCWIGKRGATC